jgi:hypothetical protein
MHYYWASVPKTHFRPTVPDANSLGVAFGASYEPWKYWVLDLVYYNRFWLRRHIDNELVEVLGTSVDGTYFSYAQEFVFGFTYKWEGLFEKSGSGEGSGSISHGPKSSS